MVENIGVIGGGIVGVAIARAPSGRRLANVTVLEKEQRGKVCVTTGHAEMVFDRLIVCAGLQSDVVAVPAWSMDMGCKHR